MLMNQPTDSAAQAAVQPQPAGIRTWVGLAALVLSVSAATGWWVRSHKADLGEQVRALAQPGDIQMFSSATCAPCLVARQWLTQHQVPFKECVIEHDAACQQTFNALMAPGTPVFQVRGQLQVGFRPERLLERLKRRQHS